MGRKAQRHMEGTKDWGAGVKGAGVEGSMEKMEYTKDERRRGQDRNNGMSEYWSEWVKDESLKRRTAE